MKRFFEIKSAISNALIDIGEKNNLESDEFETLVEILLCLKSVKIGLEELCSRNSNLLTAEGAFHFIFSKMNQLNSGFAKDTKMSLEKKI